MASFDSITTRAPTQEPIASAANYFVAINELTAHNAAVTNEETVQPTQQSPLFHSLEPYLPYTPFVLVALLFVIALGIQVINHAKNLKNVSAAFVLALLVAGIPMVLNYVGQGSRQTANAGPDEVPREVRVQPNTSSSVLISWITDAKHIGVVKLGPVPFGEKTAFVYLADNHMEEVQMHTIRVDRLKTGTTYEFEILSGTTWYDNAGNYIQFNFK